MRTRFEVTIQDVSECFAVSLGHMRDVLLDALDERQSGQSSVFTELRDFFVRIEWVSVIAFVLQMWENPVKDFPFDVPDKEFAANVGKERW